MLPTALLKILAIFYMFLNNLILKLAIDFWLETFLLLHTIDTLNVQIQSKVLYRVSQKYQ